MKYYRENHYLVLKIDDKFQQQKIYDLLKYYQQSKKSIHNLRMSKDIYLNDINVKQNLQQLLNKGDILKLPIFKETNIDFIPQKLPLEIIYEDDFLLIINKQANIEVHPDSKTGKNTLVNAVAYYYKQTNKNIPIRFINRLDKDTTGIIVFIKNYFAHNLYDYLMAKRKIKRYYLALTKNRPPQNQGIIEKRIKGMEAKTAYKVKKHYHNYTLVELELHTGRTHQIRIHLNSLNCPILGDTKYGVTTPLINRQALHAYKIEMPHPITEELLTFSAPLPLDMEKLINEFK